MPAANRLKVGTFKIDKISSAYSVIIQKTNIFIRTSPHKGIYSTMNIVIKLQWLIGTSLLAILCILT